MSIPFNLENLRYCPSDKNKDFDMGFLKEIDFETIKKGKNRLVLYSRGFYLKAFRIGKIEALFKRDMAKKEFQIAKRLYGRKRTARPLLYGRCGKWGLFLAKEIRGKGLREFLNTCWKSLTREEKKKFIKKFAVFLRDVFELSVYQPDFHLDNCLFDTDGRDFLLIDLHRAKVLKKGFDERFLLKQFQKILPPFIESKAISRTELLMATSIFSSIFPILRDKDKRVKILKGAYRDMKRHWDKKFKRRYDQICHSFNMDGQKVFRRKGFPREKIKEFLKGLQNELKGKDFSYGLGPKRLSDKLEILKNSRHTLCMKFYFEKGPFFLKAYRSSSHIKSLFYLFKSPRAKRVWYLSWKLNHMNILTPRPIFSVQYKNPWRPIYGIIVYPWKESIHEKDKALKRLFSGKDARYFTKRLALFVWDMHQRGVFHGDLKITNFSWEDERNSFSVFDLDATRVKREISKRERLKDLRVLLNSLRRKFPGTNLERSFLSYYLEFTRPFLDETKDIEGII